MVLSERIESTSFCSSASTAFARASGRFTSTPCWMRGAVTMKLMRRTSITSTSGVTLISLSVWRPPPPLDMATALTPGRSEEVAPDDVEEVVREVGHLAVEDPDLGGEVVVGDDGGDRREEADGRRDERLADGARDGGEVGVPHPVDVVERVHDPPDGAEEADEGGGAGRRAEERDLRLERGHLGGGGPLERPLDVLDPAELRAHPLGLPVLARRGHLRQLHVGGAEDGADGRGREVLRRLVDGVEPLGLPEDLQEPEGLALGLADLERLLRDD